jgi:ribosomal protein S18 acetylase RimI-like enzyme
MTFRREALCWRNVRTDDLDAVVALARLAFPDHFEDRRCFAERLSLFPKGCFALDGPAGLSGYLISYPWISMSVPPVNALIHELPARADVIYLHDLALHPDARGLGLARAAVEKLVEQAEGDGWRQIALVAVNDAAAFWKAARFRASSACGVAGLASYGDHAIYMTREI